MSESFQAAYDEFMEVCVHGVDNPLSVGLCQPLADGRSDRFGGVESRANIARNLADFMEKSPDLKSQMALAKRSGVAQATIARVLHGQQGTSSDTLDALGRALGIPAWLFLHPNPTLAHREGEFYAKLRRLYEENGNNRK